MDIDILKDPPENIPQIRLKYRKASLFCLALVLVSFCGGATTVFFNTGFNDTLEYSAFAGFILAGFVFVYFSEKLMGYRRLGIRQKNELTALSEKYPEVAAYCRKVSGQGRYIVVNEFDSIVAHTHKIKGENTEQQ